MLKGEWVNLLLITLRQNQSNESRKIEKSRHKQAVVSVHNVSVKNRHFHYSRCIDEEEEEKEEERENGNLRKCIEVSDENTLPAESM